MRQASTNHRNLWSLIVLGFLHERPMHPYEMQRLLRLRHKDELLVLKRGSLYHTVERLEKAGFIQSVETEREGNRPERTIYRLTESGSDELQTWLRELIAKPVPEPTDFFVALSFITILPREDALEQLQDRTVTLAAEIAGIEAVRAALVPQIGRLPLLEAEYAQAMRQAELDWVRAFAEELRAGKVAWTTEANP